jgi:hypothetical protein
MTRQQLEKTKLELEIKNLELSNKKLTLEIWGIRIGLFLSLILFILNP